MNRLFCAAFPALLVAGCPAIFPAADPAYGPYVNVQVTEYQDIDGFERMIAELEQRGIKATILTKPDFVTENCARIKQLADDGYEIMAFARPDDQDGQSVTLSMLSYEDQQALISQTKSAIEQCIGRTINGFRCTRFDQNEDTYAVLDSLGFVYNLGFVANTADSMPGHEQDVLPYPASDNSFWVVPMHSAYFDEGWVAFCDNPFRTRTDPAAWGALLKSELDSMHAQMRPLLVEFHPYYSGVDDDAFAAFVDFLDYAQQQNAQFITVAELVDVFGQPATDVSDTQGSTGGTTGGGGCGCTD
jgi:peptidoglycan/xylan/chitin deacetylase (PgdA/CDA1 family)